MKRKFFNSIRIVILLVAISVLLYPTVSKYLYDKNSSKVVSSYNEEAVRLSNRDKEKMIADAQEYNQEMLKNIDLLDPFSSSRREVNIWYESLLDVNGVGMMGYIRIPAIEVELPIYHGTTEKSLQAGVGHFEGTSLPVGGESTHAVLTGHRGLPTKTLFTDLDKIKEGTVFYIKILGETFAYQVDQILTVLPEDTKALSVVYEKDYVTLVTCTPYAVNTHRLLIRGYRIPYEEAISVAEDKSVEPKLSFQVNVLIIGIVVLFVTGITIYVLEKKRKRGD